MSFVLHIVHASAILSLSAYGNANGRQANIVFILADDLGYNHVGYNNPNIFSPNIDLLANTGIILEQNYVQPQCTPSRAALLTGMYPYHIGRQNDIIHPSDPTGLTLNVTLLPEVLKRNGYRTHLIGKWHLGHCNKKYLPLSRGFDTHYGFWQGAEDYYTKMRGNKIDFKDGNLDVARNKESNIYKTYSTKLYTQKIIETLRQHSRQNSNQPFFLLFSAQSIHGPIEVPKEYQNLYRNSKQEVLTTRKMLYAMVTALDDVVGNITKALKDLGLYKNTIIIFTSDNGGVAKFDKSGNKPLKGFKKSLYEGGTRVPGFVHSPLLPRSGYTSKALIHITDWFPSLSRIAGMQTSRLSRLKLDGINQFKTFFGQKPNSSRTEIVYNLKKQGKKIIGAIRRGNWKLIQEKYTTLLYNLDEDPGERRNLASTRKDITNQLKMLLDKRSSTMVPAMKIKPMHDGRDKDKDGFVRTGWCNA